MNTLQLTHILQTDPNLAAISLGVFSSNNIPHKAKPNTCLIANTAPMGDSGEHWISIFIDSDRTGCYFDSYGSKPRTSFLPFLESCSTYKYNKQRVQSDITTVCGHYCIFYLLQRARGLSQSETINYFNENLYENDEFVAKHLSRRFDLVYQPIDLDFVSQLS
jgi:hypothetical protein